MTPWAIPTILAIAGIVGLIVFVLRRPPSPRLFVPLIATQLAALIFAVGDLIVTFASDMPTHMLGLTLTYAGLISVGPAWLLLSLAFAEHQLGSFAPARSRWRFAPIGFGALLFAAFATNPWHEAFITPHIGSRSDYHALWWVHAGVAYLLLFSCAGIYLEVARRSGGDMRSRALLMIGATLAPILGNLVYILSPRPLPADPAAVGLCVSAILFSIGIYRRQLFALSPVALTEILHRETDAVVLVDDAHRILYANPAAGDLFAFQDIRVGSRFLEILAANLRPADAPDEPLDARSLEARLVEGMASPGGRLYRFGSGKLRWLRVEATPIPLRQDRGGQSLRLHDETALHTAIDAIQDQASVLRATLAATNEGLMVGDPQGFIRYFNARWRELLELPESIQPGSRVDEIREHVITRVAARESVDRQVRRVAANPGEETLDELELLDGRILESASQPLMRDGQMRGRVWRLRDMTEQRRSEAMMRHAQKLESLGVMAGGIAHDFNNLLAVIMGNASLAREEIPPASVGAACLEDLTKAAERAGALTEQLLAYAGRSELVLEELDVSMLVRDVSDLVSLSIPKGVRVCYELAEALPAVVGDASQLRQIAMNMVLNGAEAIDDGCGEVSVRTRLSFVEKSTLQAQGYQGELADGRFVMLRVTDSGCGMSEETVERIFEPFFSTKFAGRGLGLAAALGIVRSHAGCLRVESRPGEGSCFTVLLPCLDHPARRAVIRGPSSAWRSDATLLVVDDDEAVRTTASRILESVGIHVVPAANGAEAVALYREHDARIQAVLLDLTMPEMNGVQAWRALRGLDPTLPIVLSSGYPEREATGQLAGEKGLYFVRKPYEKRDLIERLREALEERRATRS